MQRFTRLAECGEPSGRLGLPFEPRRKARQRAMPDSGEAVAVVLPRGLGLRDGDLFAADDGRIVAVVAGPEAVCTVSRDDPKTLARATYHLGNRHVPVQVGEWVTVGSATSPTTCSTTCCAGSDSSRNPSSHPWHVGASLEVMARDTERMRAGAPFVMANLKAGVGLSDVSGFIVREGLPRRERARAIRG